MNTSDPIGIPAAFLFILLRQRSSLNPRLGTDEQIKDKLRREDELVSDHLVERRSSAIGFGIDTLLM